LGTIESRSLATKANESFVIRCAQPEDSSNLLAYI
jgi:hypothetical protein